MREEQEGAVNTAGNCPVCGAMIPARTPGGLCPECLLRGGLLVEESAEPAPDPPETIGPYRLGKLLGEGGMGRVFLAEQERPIQRRVALKIVKPGMDSREVLARFEAERQVVAMMDHPHIAAVLDAGTTEDGYPYFVMELVEGRPLTEFCDAERLSLRERLELFRKICDAVQHAHQKGIIHRDLKPSNILVRKEEHGRPTPKIIDFGVAKALGPDVVGATLFTAAGQLIGTPEYMSPEQALLSAGNIDTRSDVYALGVLLYELLVGTPPLERDELKKVGLEALLRTVREEEVPRPSTRLAALAWKTQTTVAEDRCVPPEKLTQTLRGDLDLIVAKSLEKEKERRYQTARDFAEDVRRYLNHEAVLATPPSPAYLFRKFARRHRTFMGASAAVALALIGGIVATTWQAREARRQRDRAEQTRGAAENLVGVMLDDLNEKLSAMGRLDLMEDITRAADDYFEEVPVEQVKDSTRLLQGRALLNRARVLKSAGDRTAELSHARRALGVARELLSIQPDDAGALALFSNCCSHLLNHQDNPDDQALRKEQLALAERLMAREVRRAVDYWIAADAELDAITTKASLCERCHKAIAIAEEGLAKFPENSNILLNKAEAYYKLGRHESDAEDRMKAWEHCVAAYRELSSREGSEHAQWRRSLAGVLQQTCWHLHTLGTRKDDAAMIKLAKSRQEEALAEYERLVVLSPHDVTLRHAFAIALHNQGKFTLLDGDLKEALTLWHRNLEQHEAIFERSPGKVVSLADCMHQVQIMLRHLKDRGEAEHKAALVLAERGLALLAKFPKGAQGEICLDYKHYSMLLNYLDEVQIKLEREIIDLPAEWKALLAGLEQRNEGSTSWSSSELTIQFLACKGLATHAVEGGDQAEGLQWLAKAEEALVVLARDLSPTMSEGQWKLIYGRAATRLSELYLECGNPKRAAKVRAFVFPQGNH